MARTKGVSLAMTANRRSEFMDYVRNNADSNDIMVLKINEAACALGLTRDSIRNYMKHFQTAGQIVVEHIGLKEGYMVQVLKDISNKSPSEIVVKTKHSFRKCSKCGTEAPDFYAKFCYKCGAALLSEKEQLREEFQSAVHKIYKLSDDSRSINEIMKVMARVDNYAFGEKKGESNEV